MFTFEYVSILLLTDFMCIAKTGSYEANFKVKMKNTPG